MYETVRRCCPDARIIFNAGDVHHLRIDREARLTDPRLAARAADAKEKETFLVRNTDATIVVSDVELQYLNKLVPGANVIHVPLIRDIPGSTKGYAERADIAFVGYFLHPPNPDAVQLFVSAIWPRVKAALPDVRLKLIGAFWPQQIPRPSGPGIEMVGHVQDLGAALEKLRLTVAPLRFGAGAKGKIVSSLSHGVPCVATPIATEGMGLVDGVSVLVADRTDLFAQKVIAAYRDEALWNRLSAGGLEAVRRNHSFENGLRLIGGMLAGIGVAPPMAEAS
jgi:glycosyltransferase involved in cell wall biosynthesis